MQTTSFAALCIFRPCRANSCHRETAHFNSRCCDSCATGHRFARFPATLPSASFTVPSGLTPLIREVHCQAFREHRRAVGHARRRLMLNVCRASRMRLAGSTARVHRPCPCARAASQPSPCALGPSEHSHSSVTKSRTRPVPAGIEKSVMPPARTSKSSRSSSPSVAACSRTPSEPLPSLASLRRACWAANMRDMALDWETKNSSISGTFRLHLAQFYDRTGIRGAGVLNRLRGHCRQGGHMPGVRSASFDHYLLRWLGRRGGDLSENTAQLSSGALRPEWRSAKVRIGALLAQ